jgi:hypothetical protein
MAALGGAGLAPYGLGADRHGWVPWVPSTRRSREASRWREVSAPIRDAAWLAAPSRPTSSGWPCDPTPRLAMWSTQDPVMVFGVVKSSSGVDELGRIFRWLGSRFADGTADASSWSAPASVAIWPTPWATSTPQRPWTVPRPVHPWGDPPLASRARRVEDRPPPWRLPPVDDRPFAEASAKERVWARLWLGLPPTRSRRADDQPLWLHGWGGRPTLDVRRPTAATGWPANAPAAPTAARPSVPTVLADPSVPRSRRRRPIPANLHAPDRPDAVVRWIPSGPYSLWHAADMANRKGGLDSRRARQRRSI